MRIRRLALTGLIGLAACGEPAKPLDPSDWQTSFRGSGQIRARIESEFDEPVTLRFEDAYQRIEAQVVLAPRRMEIVYLSQGSVTVSEVVVRNGRRIVRKGPVYHLWAPVLPGSDQDDVHWRFFP